MQPFNIKEKNGQKASFLPLLLKIVTYYRVHVVPRAGLSFRGGLCLTPGRREVSEQT